MRSSLQVHDMTWNGIRLHWPACRCTNGVLQAICQHLGARAPCTARTAPHWPAQPRPRLQGLVTKHSMVGSVQLHVPIRYTGPSLAYPAVVRA